MPTLPWSEPHAPGPGAEALVMASRFEVRSLRDVPGFFLASITVWRQARRSPGAWGVALKAQPLRRTFWTVSAWSDRAAVGTYARTEPHLSTMRRKRSVMRDSTFVFWSVPAAELPITWSEVERRVAAERRKAS